MLRKFIDQIKPKFAKGEKFHFLHSTFEAFETFLYVPNKVTSAGAHIRDNIDTKRAISMVIVALIPALLFGIYNVGYQHFLSLGETVDFWQTVIYGLWQVIPIVVVSYVTGLGIEFAVAQMRGHEVNEGFLVTGMIIPLLCPPDVPLWMVAIATAFAVIIGKEVFGGTGMNVWNPALVARAFLFFAYPSQMSGDNVWIAERGDAITGATPLAKLSTGIAEMDLTQMFYGLIPGSIGETSKIAILLGAIILLWTGVASFRIMLSVVLGGLAMGSIFNLVGGENVLMNIPPYQHLLMGGFLFGTIFMATDPVTASQTGTGKWLYGFLIGVIAVLIRVVNPAYPEGMMLSILFMNTFAPLIDHYVVEANKKRRLKRAMLVSQQTL
ncbi:MAG: NADH:ubiquinone reductase (Na(+)-transporting) subunit B [Bacteroidales bacterium]|jgi:Na+-transporting NADH:ubiquinone oxidoreductase subunit B|nr:NADH:ubiquinone reductase (Na(+)-transporting) subunit B [Bacteroidales bacterium]